jgi:hypothetical protein
MPFRARASANATPMVQRRRGPNPKMPDAELLKAIRDDPTIRGFALQRRGAPQGFGAATHCA